VSTKDGNLSTENSRAALTYTEVNFTALSLIFII
jgi:hypothetical protein